MLKLSLVIPCFNESQNIAKVFSMLDFELSTYTREYIFIDDGSTDSTLKEIEALARLNNHVKYISLSRNFGHQNALKAGIDNASGACVITMDADFQHPPHLIPDMIKKWEQGADIVCAIAEYDKSVSFFKKITSKFFYRIFSFVSDLKVKQYMSSDFRLLDRKIVDILKAEFDEYFLFYRGIIGWIGFKQDVIFYKPSKRYFGKTKYSYNKMCSLAFNGITSFSIKPLRLITYTGVFISLLSFLYGIYALYIAFFTNKAITGWTSVILSILIIGGLQLFFLGIIGEYLGKLFFEIKKRPQYLIKSKNF